METKRIMIKSTQANNCNQKNQSKTVRERVIGALLGKSIGGTLGQPWEGCTGPLALTFYDPVPTGMAPNDDMDIQVIRAGLLAGRWQNVVSYPNLREAFVGRIDFPCDEYGVAIRNLEMGIMAPYSGSYDNAFVDGLGGAIRSEIWAIVAHGNPKFAAALATVDASVDHAGDGVYAEVFLAALEAAAFAESDITRLIEIGLGEIPSDCRLAEAIRDTVKWCNQTNDAAEIRHWIMDDYGSDNFTDVVMNVPFMVAALLLGKGDFGRSICLAVNFGQDTDCTGATVGAILGLLNPDAIPENWLAPIGRELLISPGYVADNPPRTLDDFADLLLTLSGNVVLDARLPEPPDWSKYTISFRRSEFRPYFVLDSGKFAPQMGAWTLLTVPGNDFRLDFTNLPPETLVLLETDLELREALPVRLLVNTDAYCRVWLDDKECFSRDGGAFVPAFHRAPLNQSKMMELAAGRHKLCIGLAPAHRKMTSCRVVFGLSDRNCRWLPR